MRIIAVTLCLLGTTPLGAQEAPGPFAAYDAASEAILSGPTDLEMGPDGRLYVTERLTGEIAVMDPESLELIERIGEGRFYDVQDLSFGDDGRILVAVKGAGQYHAYPSVEALSGLPETVLSAPRIEGVLAHTNGLNYAMASAIGVLAAISGNTVTAETQGLYGAHDLAEAPDGTIWVADTRTRALVQYSADLERLRVIDHPKFGLGSPRYLDVTDFGQLVVADTASDRILMIDPDGPEGGTLLGVLGTGEAGMGPNVFDNPDGVEVVGNRFYLSDTSNNRIVRYSIVLF